MLAADAGLISGSNADVRGGFLWKQGRGASSVKC